MTDTNKHMTAARRKEMERRRARILRDLNAAALDLRNAEQRLKDAVMMARAVDLDGYCAASWSEVAAALGVTRQAVAQRFGREAPANLRWKE